LLGTTHNQSNNIELKEKSAFIGWVCWGWLRWRQEFLNQRDIINEFKPLPVSKIHKEKKKCLHQ